MNPATQNSRFGIAPRLAACLALASFCLAATAETIRGSGTPRTETRAVSGFTAIALALPARLELTQGDGESLTVTADDNLIGEIETVVEDGTLKLRFTRKYMSWRNPKIVIAVTARSIAALAVAGSGDIFVAKLKAEALAIKVAGSGDVKIAALEAGALKVSVSGSGDVSLAGRATSLDARIAGSGDLVAGKLETPRAKVSVAGSGDAIVWAREELTVSVSGSADVRYYGDPSVKRSVSGSGTVKRLGTAPA